MSPLDRRRRRRLRPIGALAIVGLILLALLIGGALKIGSSSTTFWRSVDQSYATAARAVVNQSNRTGTQLTELLADMASRTRQGLEAQLDTLVRTSQSTAQAAADLRPPTPPSGVGTLVANAFTGRATALARFRAVIDGLLSMAPLPVAGAPGSQTGDIASLSSAAATTALGQVGAQLIAADRTYQTARHRLPTDPGDAHLPASVWVLHAGSWDDASASAMVGALLGAPHLQAVHQVVLLTQALQLTPAPVPQGATALPAGTSVVPPTHALHITAVVANQGNVDDPHVQVTAEVQPTGKGSLARRSHTIALAAGSSSAVQLAPLPVVPGRNYSVTVSVAPPAGEVAGSATSTTFTIEVAPATKQFAVSS